MQQPPQVHHHRGVVARDVYEPQEPGGTDRSSRTTSFPERTASPRIRPPPAPTGRSKPRFDPTRPARGSKRLAPGHRPAASRKNVLLQSLAPSHCASKTQLDEPHCALAARLALVRTSRRAGTHLETPLGRQPASSQRGQRFEILPWHELRRRFHASVSAQARVADSVEGSSWVLVSRDGLRDVRRELAEIRDLPVSDLEVVVVAIAVGLAALRRAFR